MAVERERDELAETPSAEYWRRRRDEGWRPVAVEWERSDAAAPHEAGRVAVPYGLRATPDGAYLVADPVERGALERVLELVEADRPLSAIAGTLNADGRTTRDGRAWTAVDVFELLPRLVEVAPEIHAGAAWRSRRGLRAVS